jgi:hypothetical protein
MNAYFDAPPSERKAVLMQQIKQQELGLKAQEMDLRRLESATNVDLEQQRFGLEREKIADGQSARKEKAEADRRAKMSEDDIEDDDAEKAGKPSRTDRLIEAMSKQQQELVHVLTRPKKLVRGPDGRAVGVE